MKKFLKKIKIFYKEHRVFTILMAIVLVCLVLILTVLFQCFYIGKNTDKYGNRLENIKQYEITSSRLTDYEKNMENDVKVNNAEIKITGKIIYIKLLFNTNVDLLEAESVALKSLEKFSKEEQGYYDFNITLKEEKTATNDGFLISGAKNANGSGLVWNNNRQVVETEKDEG